MSVGLQVREMVNKFNEQVSKEGKTEVVHAGDPDGTLFLINPDVVLTPVHNPCWSTDPENNIQRRRCIAVGYH